MNGWRLAAAARELREGELVEANLPEGPVFLLRTESGVLVRGARCPHMGADLRYGPRRGARVTCALHAWEFDVPSGACIAGSRDASLSAFSSREAFGAVFVQTGEGPLPAFDSMLESEVAALPGGRVEIACAPLGVALNAFDVAHLGTVHQRELLEPPEFGAFGDAFRLRYASRPSGRAPSDRLMLALSKGRIEVTITALSPYLITVESRAGTTTSGLLVGLSPGGAGTEVFPVFCVKRSGGRLADALRTRLSRWLYTEFLKRDLVPLTGFALTERSFQPDDESVRAFLEWARSTAS